MFTSSDYALVGRKAIEAVDFPFLHRLDHWRRLDRVIESGDTVACWLTFGGTAKETGRSFQNDVCNVFKFASGQIVSWQSYGDFSEVMAAFS